MNSMSHPNCNGRCVDRPIAFRQHGRDNYVGTTYSAPGIKISTTWHPGWGFRFELKASASLDLADAKYLHAALSYLIEETQR